jgi:hypothetical protein
MEFSGMLHNWRDLTDRSRIALTRIRPENIDVGFRILDRHMVDPCTFTIVLHPGGIVTSIVPLHPPTSVHHTRFDWSFKRTPDLGKLHILFISVPNDVISRILEMRLRVYQNSPVHAQPSRYQKFILWSRKVNANWDQNKGIDSFIHTQKNHKTVL